MDLSLDAFLDGKIHVAQPLDGYRAATDPVYLAASVPARAGQSVLDVGCGVGTASLCLGARVEGAHLTGIEIQDDYAALARENAERNDLSLEVYASDLTALPIDLRQRSFDHVMTNPPFFKPDSLSAPENAQKSVAHLETMALEHWIKFSLKRLTPKGSFSVIHLADRLPEILTAMAEVCGDIRVLPITARAGRPAKRVLVQGVKTSKAPLQLLAPFIVHDGDRHDKDGDDYSQAAKQVLRRGHALRL